jgi:raffinose/stachyose/melibiose transport system substrate-binding protein
MQSTHRTGARGRLVTAGALAASVGIALAGCSGGGAAEEGTGTLTIQVQSVQQPAFEYAAEIFNEAHPDVEVVFQTVTEDQKATTNAQIMASNDAPDIGLVPTNAQPYQALIAADALVPLDDLWAEEDLEARYGASITSALESNGSHYTILFDTVFYNVVYYNKDAFAAAGVDAPENHQIASNDELYDIVGKLDAAGYDGVSMGGAAGYQFGWLVDAQVAANASDSALADFLTSWQPGAEQKVPFTDSNFTDSIAQIQEWNDNGVFPDGVVGIAGDQAQAAFTAGDAAMFLGGTWIPSILGEVDFEYDWLLLPGAGDTPTLPTIYAGDTLAIPRTSKNIELAKEFLGIYNSDDVQTFAASVGSLPAVNTVDPSTLTELGPIVQSIIAFTNTTGFGLGLTSTLPGELGGVFIDPQVQQVVSGQSTPEKVGQAMQEAFENWKSKSN